MPRPKIPRRLFFNPNVYYFKPRGIPLRLLDEINLERDEVEALKLYDFDGLDQESASKKMGVSQPTFARIMKRSHKKIANAIISGKAIKIEKL
jgi:predicted DNA-binding protein (UPF0251 family)